MILILAIVALFISFAFHISYLVRYIKQRDARYLQRYIFSAVSNVLIAMVMIYVALYMPEQVQKINMKLLMWFISGAVMVLMLMVKIAVFRRIYKRSKMEEHYHLNFFGKKVLHSSVVKPIEIGIFFGSMPLFLFAGAYFVARLLNILMYGHL